MPALCPVQEQTLSMPPGEIHHYRHLPGIARIAGTGSAITSVGKPIPVLGSICQPLDWGASSGWSASTGCALDSSRGSHAGGDGVWVRTQLSSREQ